MYESIYMKCLEEANEFTESESRVMVSKAKGRQECGLTTNEQRFLSGVMTVLLKLAAMHNTGNILKSPEFYTFKGEF